MSLPEFKLLRPRSLDEAVGFLAKHANGRLPDCASLPAALILIPSMRQKLFEPEYVLDVRHIAELQGIREQQGNGVEIGALTSLTAIEHSQLLAPPLFGADRSCCYSRIARAAQHGHDRRATFAWIRAASGTTSRLPGARDAAFASRKMAICVMSPPVEPNAGRRFRAILLPRLLCLNAEVEIVSPRGARRIPLREFYTGLGDDYRKLQPDELLTRVFLARGCGRLSRRISQAADSWID